jgi:hypothetical protein
MFENPLIEFLMFDLRIFLPLNEYLNYLNIFDSGFSLIEYPL